MKKILVTGAQGFVGKRLVLSLESHAEYDILELDKEYLLDLETWEENLQQTLNLFSPDVVFHVGACSDTLEKRVNYMMIRNYEATKILMDWCKYNDVPMIYSSSAASYGTNGRTPSNLYGWSKYAAENYVVSSHGIGLRYFNVYGPGEEHKGKMASFIYQSFVKDGKGEKIFLFPKKPRRDFVHVEDVVRANIFAWENFQDLEKQYYEVGTGTATPFEELMHHMGFKYTHLNNDKIPEGYQFYTCSDKNKWMRGWEPKLDVKAGVKQYKRYLRKER